MFALVCTLCAAMVPDGTHGRIEGDLAASLGVGATFGPRAPRASLDLRFRYLQSAGLFGTYEDGPLVGSSAEPRRVLATGVELRPFFIYRWLQGHETGHPYWDLSVDSFGIELGAVFMQPESRPFGAKPGLQLGLGLEFPIFPRATGLFLGLHGGVRWSDSALNGQPLETPTDRSLYLAVTVSWQQIFGSHIVDLGDAAP